jgi:ribonucleoside-triphosphate reductase
MNKGKKFLSELKLYSDYLKWKDDLGRYETWDEAYDEILDQHLTKYGKGIQDLLDEVRPVVQAKGVLASQRNLQFRGDQIFKHNTKLYNCSVLYAYSPDMFKKGFYMLLSGCGLGISIKNKFIQHLPKISIRNGETLTHVIQDSIEGWAEAIHVLISSYVKHPSLDEHYYGKNIRFDYSLIRPKGAFISGGFKAPGPDGLKQSMEKIEEFLNVNPGKFTSYKVYNIFMHLSDAVLSGGVRRSAMNVVFDYEDKEMLYAKTGNWRQEKPHFARSNNSVGLIKGQFTKDQFQELLDLNKGDNDVGFVLQTTEDQMFNPCFEISFSFFDQIKDLNDTVIQMCNLTEISASYCKNRKGNLSVDKFYEQCRVAAILGTLQAGYTDFPFLGKQTEDIVAGEALLGVSITGWMDNLDLFNENILRKGAEIVKETNREVAKRIGINIAARTTCVKPSGNASVVLGTPSGIHPEHATTFFRVMQINKESEVAKWLLNNYPEMLEESRWSQTNSDYVIFVPIENDDDTYVKEELKDIDHIKMIELVQRNWVKPGTNPENCYNNNHYHNVSNTILIDNKEKITDYIFENQENFTAVSFLERTGDKDYTQAPNTSIMTEDGLIHNYEKGAILASGLIVDGLHAFNNDLWAACTALETGVLEGFNRQLKLLQEDWIRRAKKFAKNYFNNDLKKTIYCIKDVHLFHKWETINRRFKKVPKFEEILSKPEYVDIDTLASVACAGGSCEI